jgi:hypothetical protein
MLSEDVSQPEHIDCRLTANSDAKRDRSFVNSRIVTLNNQYDKVEY